MYSILVVLLISGTQLGGNPRLRIVLLTKGTPPRTMAKVGVVGEGEVVVAHRALVAKHGGGHGAVGPLAADAGEVCGVDNGIW